MNKYQVITILLAIFMVSLAGDTYAQRSKKKRKRTKSSKTDEYFKDNGKFTDRLWYGGGVNLGFSGGTNYSLFRFGLSPMVGYKVMDRLSVGPRVSFDYTFLKGNAVNLRTGGISVEKGNLFSYSGGIFSRYKIINTIFLHTEVEFQSLEQVGTLSGFLVYDDEKDNLVTVRGGHENVYLGAGYNSGDAGGWGYEIVVLYNFNEPDDSIDLPFTYRIGLTYNF